MVRHLNLQRKQLLKNKKLIIMTIVKRNYNYLNSMFDEFFNTVPATINKELNASFAPVNVHETDEAYHIELVAPGLKREDFKVDLEKGILTISYEKKVATENQTFKTHRREFIQNSFKRSFTVEDKINEDGIVAKYEDGVLKLFLPKKEQIKLAPKQISIQ